MKTEFQGDPVAGGTFPAGIWKTFMESVLKIDPPPQLKKDEAEETVPGATAPPGAAATPAPAAPAPTQPEETAPETDGGGGSDAPEQPEAGARGALRHPAGGAAADPPRPGRRRPRRRAGRRRPRTARASRRSVSRRPLGQGSRPSASPRRRSATAAPPPS